MLIDATFHEHLKLIKGSRLVHSNWYREQFPEVAELKIDPAVHYLRYGAQMGRNPGKTFDTKFYLNTYPDAAASGLNPLVHYVLFGRDANYLTRPPKSDPRRQIAALRTALSMGNAENSLKQLRELAGTGAQQELGALAGRELARWHMSRGTIPDYKHALEWIEQSRCNATDLDFRSKLNIAELLCHYHLGDSQSGTAAYERAALAGEVVADLTLARANFEEDHTSRIAWINVALDRHGIPPVKLLPGDADPYDRLSSAQNLPTVQSGPKVSILIAAYEAHDMLPTALRSLQEQTWQNIEIIVIDDCSPSGRTSEVARRFAANDSRISVISMPENGGAYIARNCGLDHASGDYVTLHDADDWSHPLKIEMQVRYLEDNASVMGCMSQQARITPALKTQMLRANGGFVMMNMSSFMWRREPVREALGYWDTVRFGADSEFIRRVKRVFGDTSVEVIPGSFLSFQREAPSSITSDEFRGLDSLAFGVRREYHDLQAYYHDTARSLKYKNDPNDRPFPVPELMTNTNNNELADNSYDVVVYADLSEESGDLEHVLEKIEDHSGRIGLVAISPNLAGSANAVRPTAHCIRQAIHERRADMLVFGMRATAKQIVHLSGASTKDMGRYIPDVRLADEADCRGKSMSSNVI